MMLSDMHVFQLLSYSRLNSFWDTYMYLNRLVYTIPAMYLLEKVAFTKVVEPKLE